MFLIVGLGNPGKEYENTRHNIGFDAIDKIAEKYNIELNRIKFKSVYGEGFIGGEKVILIWKRNGWRREGNCGKTFDVYEFKWRKFKGNNGFL